MWFLLLAALLLLASIFGESKHVLGRFPLRSQNLVLGNSRNTTLPVINSRGIGYYYTSFYSGTGCSGTPTYQEGYATGKCLRLGSPTGLSSPSGTSIRMDCSATLDGLQVQYFSASTTCTGMFTTMVYPVGSSTGGNCYPLMNTYLSQALQLYNLGLGSFKPMCMFITPTTPGVPVSADFQRSALVESVYQYPGGCFVDSVFNLPDVFKAFVQTTPLVSYCASKLTTAQAIAPYNTNAIGQVTCPNSAVFAFAGNFDGACVIPSSTTVGTNVEHNKCYGPTKFTTTISPIIEKNVNLPINAGTLPSLSNTFSLTGATSCRNTCLKIYPTCARPTGQPSMQPSNQPTTMPSRTVRPSRAPTSAPTVAPSFSLSPTAPSGQPTMQPSQQPTNRPTIRPTMQPSSEPTMQPTTQPTLQPSRQPTRLPTSQPTQQPSQQPTMQPSRQPTQQPTIQPTQQPTRQPTQQPTMQPSRQPTSQPTMQPSQQPTVQPSQQPTMQPSSQPTQQPSSQPSVQPTMVPSMQPSRQPTSSPSRATKSPLLTPATQPSGQPTMHPSMQPTRQPTVRPSAANQKVPPTGQPSQQPTQQPSQQPTQQPSIQPTSQPTMQPSQQPTSQPSQQPTQQPTMQPSRQPTSQPTRQPTQQPTSQPSQQPTRQPSSQPTMQPSEQPTSRPSRQPTQQPTRQPSQQPTTQPSQQPTSFPTSKPTKWTYSTPPNIGGCNTTALKNCLNCMVAPPGFSVATLYKQYTCVGQPLSAIPTTSPTFEPISSSVPTLMPTVTWSPTFQAGNVPGAVPVATVSVVQSLPGISLATANTPAFQTTFISTTANQLGVPTSAITGYTATGTRRRNLLAVSIAYMVTATNTNPNILANIIQSNSAALGQALTTAGYPTTVSTQATPMTGPTVTPVASPNAVGSPSSAACFAGTELVTLESGDNLPMSDVQVGDRILTVNTMGDKVFSNVVYLPHGRNDEHATFAQLSTESGRDLQMTLNHMLPAGLCDLSTLPLIAVSQVKEGDCVQTVNGREQVVSIRTVEGKGIYTVIAMEEMLVVNGIIATPYGGINPTLANIYYNLYRLAYAIFGSNVFTLHKLVQHHMETIWSVMSEL